MTDDKAMGVLFINKSKTNGKIYLTGTINGKKVFGSYGEKEKEGKDGKSYLSKMFFIREDKPLEGKQVIDNVEF